MQNINEVLVGDHFEQVETAVNEIISNLKSKRCRLESQLSSPSDYATSINGSVIIVFILIYM